MESGKHVKPVNTRSENESEEWQRLLKEANLDDATMEKNMDELREEGQTETTGNKYGKRFVVPLEIYSNPTYREYLNYAQTEKSVKVIVDEYYRKYGFSLKSGETKKKKHWWH